jgi:TAG lipase/steryl ester hydrolase/phospholipase A2/LPA acyltransferase
VRKTLASKLRNMSIIPLSLRRILAVELLYGRRLVYISLELYKRIFDATAWMYKPMRLNRRRLSVLGRPFRRYHGVAAVLVAFLVARSLRNLYMDSISGKRARKRVLKQVMDEAASYEQWHEAAKEFETIENKGQGGMKSTFNSMYDVDLIRGRVEYLKKIQARGDILELMYVLRSDLLRNAGNIADATTLIQPPTKLPDAIQEYISLTKACLRDIADSPLVTHNERLAFLRETRHAFGRTALVLSGGGSFGAFHLGVVKALLDASLLPRVLSGSSAGAIVVAMVGTRTRAELTDLFSSLDSTLHCMDFYSHNTPYQLTRHLITKGTLQDHHVLQDRLQRLLGEYTFEEAYARSGICLNVAVSAADTTEPVRLLNYLTAPNVLVWSAVACSSAFPFLFAPQTLLARDSRGHIAPFANKSAGESQRRWRDGSLESDLPMRGLSELFNVNYFLVSQCNPYLLPVIAAKEAIPRPLGSLIESEFKHRCQQLMEIMPRKMGASKVIKLLSQPWQGDVTMVLPVTTLSALKSIINMSKEDIMRAKTEGQKATWSKLVTILTNCDIEVTLDECLRQVSLKSKLITLGKRVRTKSQAQLRSNPSWLRLSSLALPHTDSFERPGMNSIHVDKLTSSVPENLDHLEGAGVNDAYGTNGSSVIGDGDSQTWEGRTNVESDKDIWKNLFNLAGSKATVSNWGIDFVAP